MTSLLNRRRKSGAELNLGSHSKDKETGLGNKTSSVEGLGNKTSSVEELGNKTSSVEGPGNKTSSEEGPGNETYNAEGLGNKTSSVESLFKSFKPKSRHTSGDSKQSSPCINQDSFLNQLKLQILGTPTDKSSSSSPTSPSPKKCGKNSPSSGKVFNPLVHVYCQPQMMQKRVKGNSSSSRRTKSESSSELKPETKGNSKKLARSMSMFAPTTPKKMSLKKKSMTFCNLQSVEESQEPITYEDWRDRDEQEQNNH